MSLVRYIICFRDDGSGLCNFFTYYEEVCYLLKTCDNIDYVQVTKLQLNNFFNLLQYTAYCPYGKERSIVPCTEGKDLSFK